jgi:hypothetical protein
MASLGSHLNVWNTCLQLLRRRGYRLAMVPGEEDDLSGFTAERDGFTFAADNPIELLGLTAIYEEVQPAEDRSYWWTAKNTDEDIYDELLDAAVAIEAARVAELEALRARDGAAWEAEIREGFTEGGDLVNAATVLRLSRQELRRLLEDPRLADLRARGGPSR